MADDPAIDGPAEDPIETTRPSSYRLTRFVLLRLLGLVYVAAFAALLTQVVPLIGRRGLLPAAPYLDAIAAHFGSRAAGFLEVPTLFWLDASDACLLAMAWIGLVLSIIVMLGFANAVLMTVLWMLYMSFVHVGQLWYGYGWEIQLLETGFLAIFLCPLVDLHPLPRHPPPAAVIVLFRWLTFRIMLGAGLIKIRGDACWRDLTCLYYHYETQPIPNPLSRTLHFMPRAFHQAGVLYNHVCELIAPWFVFGPWRTLRHWAGALLLVFQLILIASGNLSFLNWLTIVPVLACFDDSLLGRVLPGRIVRAAEQAADRSAADSAEASPSKVQRFVVAALVLSVALLSITPVLNLLSGHQAMNASFDPLDLVNTYGAFGSVGKHRDELIFEGTDSEVVDEGTEWRPYEFPCKPGDPNRRPCLSGPYHRRLDWQVWFAAMSNAEEEPWTVHLIWKLLHNDPGALSLLAGNPFPNAPPRAIRVMLYRYELAPPGDAEGSWWKRSLAGAWLPPLTAADPRLRAFLSSHGWLDEEEIDGGSDR